MKKLLLVLPLVVLTTGPLSAETIKLTCRTGLSKTDPSVKELYDVTVTIADEKATLNIDGQEFILEQENDAGISFSRWDPWYRFAIGDRQMASKYSLGIPTEEDFARYTTCEEVK